MLILNGILQCITIRYDIYFLKYKYLGHSHDLFLLVCLICQEEAGMKRVFPFFATIAHSASWALLSFPLFTTLNK